MTHEKTQWATTSYATTPSPDRSPRHGCAWNRAEDRDLLRGREDGLSVEALAARHERSYESIRRRLELHGLTPDDEQPSRERKRQAVLLALYHGRYGDRMKEGHGAVFADLDLQGLVCFADALCKRGPTLTDAGLREVRRLSTPSPRVEMEYAPSLLCHRLTSAQFWMVASGVCVGKFAGSIALVDPPRFVHATRHEAEAEAERLAQAHPGRRFFVLQATSAHESTEQKIVTHTRKSL